MPSKARVKDPILVQKVNDQLRKRGIRTPCRVTVTARNGQVTLSGEIQYEMQRRTAMHAAREVQGVNRAIDQLKVKAAGAGWARK